MRKQYSIIVTGLFSVFLLASCGMPGPLYQEEQKENKQSENSTQDASHQQEEK